MKIKSVLDNKLTDAANKIEMELLQKYPLEKVSPVLKKLRDLIKHVIYNPQSRSIAIFVSPVGEKVYYFTHSDRRRDDYRSAF